MATSNKTSSKNNIGCDNLVDNAFVSTMGKDNAPKWESKEIVSYVPVHDQGADLFDIVDGEVERESLHIANGENSVILLGCTLVTETETRKQRLHLVLEDVATGAIENVNLFPGNAYTDMQGKKIPAGHNWKALVEEVKRQRNEDGIGYKPMGFSDFIKRELTKGFRTWILWDGKYTNIYVTYNKYQAALDRLAKEQKKGK